MTMRRFPVCVAALLLATACVSPALAAGNVNLVLGGRTLSDDAFWNDQLPANFSSQAVFGVDVNFGPSSWPIRLEAGAHASVKQETFFGSDVTASVGEGYFGVNKTWNQKGGKLYPFIGGGVANVTATIDARGSSRDDDSSGYYLHGGVFFRLGRRFNLGVDVRALRGTSMTIGGVDFDSDYNQAGLLLGWGWPARW
jgi:outer membrane protein with beta-barrel domain